MTPQNRLQRLLATDISALSDSEALNRIGLLIDLASDLKSPDGSDRALELLEELQARSLTPDIAALLHYFRANAWDNKPQPLTPDQAWAWEQPERQEQILELRRAVRHDGFDTLHPVRQCQVLSNLANQLSHIGRFIEAVETWDRALTGNKHFAMALGNRSHGLTHYARALYDRGHAGVLYAAAHNGFAAATAEDAYYESPSHQQHLRATFASEAQNIAKHLNLARIRRIMSRRYSIGKGVAEKRYRSWCLDNRLFVNPMNDLGPLSIAARDVLNLPSITEASHSPHPPAIIGFFNQMKQEFASARYLHYDATHSRGVHFSDRDVRLCNTLDYPAYSFATEKLRASFRVAYSLFDKISFFLNEYFSLGHKPAKVSFRSVWYQKADRGRPLLQVFAESENWPLRGLFWLSKDLFEDDFKSVTEPDAAALNDIRNHLEHKYLQLHVEGLAPVALENDSGEPERLAYALTTHDFAAKTLRLLKLVRAALIYLSLSVHREEGRRATVKTADRLVVPMVLDTWEDDWKR